MQTIIFQILNSFIEINETVYCAPPQMKSIIFHTGILITRKLQLPTWFFCFSWCPFFAFLRAEKHVFHIAPFRSTSYELKSFRCLEVSNRVSNWNKGKNLCLVGISNMPKGRSGILLQFNVSEFIMNLRFVWVPWI